MRSTCTWYGIRFREGTKKCSKIRPLDVYTILMNILKRAEWHTLNEGLVWCVNFISMKVFKDILITVNSQMEKISPLSSPLKFVKEQVSIRLKCCLTISQIHANFLFEGDESRLHAQFLGRKDLPRLVWFPLYLFF